MSLRTVYYGAVITPQSLTVYKALPNCLLAVSAQGTVDWVVENVPKHLLQDVLAQKDSIDANLVTLDLEEFLLPGFIDTHTHAPQFPNIGSGQQYELLDWLNNVTFPMEAKFQDSEFAKGVYQTVVRQIINCGTTTCCYYGTLHLEATKILADIVHVAGQRAFIGKCNMDRESPSYYIEPSPEVSVSDTMELISHIRSLSSSNGGYTSSPIPPLVMPILTPRFAIACSPKLLSLLGKLASNDPSLHIQTHISENKGEISLVRKLFPECKSYADVYNTFGLLRRNTILAHGVHLGDEEVTIIKEQGAGISHCPTSNFNLRSGVAPIGHYLDQGVKVGLGTDVSGGFHHSVLNAIQNASIASKIHAMKAVTDHDATGGKFANRQFSVATLLYLATLGGAEVCDIDKTVGSFVPGKSFDALLVSMPNSGADAAFRKLEKADIAPGKRVEVLQERLERFLFCGDDRNIQKVYVQGRFIGGTAYQTK